MPAGRVDLGSGWAGDLGFSLIFLLHRDRYGMQGGIMKKLLILSAGFLFAVGLMSTAWAHGPKGSGSGFRGHGFSKSHFNKSTISRSGVHFRQHLRKSGRGLIFRNHGRSKARFKRFANSPRRHLRQHRRFRDQGVNRSFRRFRNSRFFSPFLYNPYYGYGDSLPRQDLRPAPQHTSSSRIYYNENPEPWFLYGKGKQFRQMGLIPPTQ